MKWFVTLPFVLAFLASGVAAAQTGPKIAFVDLEYALNNVDEGKKAKALLEQNYKQKKTELEAAAAELQRKKTELESQSLVLSDEARRTKEEEYLKAVEKYEADKKSAFEQWQKKEATLTRDLLEGLTQIVQEIGREGNYTFILERHDASVLYAQDNIDLTKQVIERFNKRGGR